LSKGRGREFHTLHTWKNTGKNLSVIFWGISIQNLKVETVVSHRQSKEEYRMEM